jgi:hemerythrin-like domain-containing protein
MDTNSRRSFLTTAATLGLTTLVARPLLAADKNDEGEAEVEISAPEDLMREHGALNRILLIYEAAMGRLRAKEDVPPEVFEKPARLVRQFVEDYHERLEENFIFPRFEKHNTLVELVTTLRQQHQAGRTLTDIVLQNAVPARFARPEAQRRVIVSCEQFIRMYRPHETREDTVLFPAIYQIMPAAEVRELGEQFEEREHQLFGGNGFQETVGKVAEIEKQLGIYELAQFTPQV